MTTTTTDIRFAYFEHPITKTTVHGKWYLSIQHHARVVTMWGAGSKTRSPGRNGWPFMSPDSGQRKYEEHTSTVKASLAMDEIWNRRMANGYRIIAADRNFSVQRNSNFMLDNDYAMLTMLQTAIRSEIEQWAAKTGMIPPKVTAAMPTPPLTLITVKDYIDYVSTLPGVTGVTIGSSPPGSVRVIVTGPADLTFIHARLKDRIDPKLTLHVVSGDANPVTITTGHLKVGRKSRNRRG